jgi:hypothetical protein
MVGKVPDKTKPTIMIVSDDKRRRKEAFQIVQSRNLLAMFPGFELGHCSVAAEFDDLRLLGSGASSLEAASARDREDVQNLDDRNLPGDEILTLLSAEVCAFDWPNTAHPTRLYFHTSPNFHCHDFSSATCGGVFRHSNELYALTMAHAIHPTRHAAITPEKCESPSDASSQSDDFEITGVDDWDEDDDGDTRTLTALTSPGSKSSSEVSDSEGSLFRRQDSHRSSDISIRTRLDMSQSIVYEDNCIMRDCEDDVEEEDVPQFCNRVGSVVSVDQVLDIAVIKVTAERSMVDASFSHALFDMTLDSKMGHDLTNPSITIETTHHPEIRGRYSETPYYTRLPGTGSFLELQRVQLGTSLRPGDSGSWAFDDERRLVGFVMAGSPNTASCLLLPARTALRSMLTLLVSRDISSSSSFDGPLPDFRLDVSRNSPDEDSVTVASSYAPPSIFSRRADRSTPSTKANSAITAPYEMWAIQTQGRLLRGEDSPGGLASKGNFWEDQSARLRRELERAWEIIQEKDQRLQSFIIGDAESAMASVRRHGSRETSPETPVLSREEAFSVNEVEKTLQTLKIEMKGNRALMEELLAMWKTQVDFSEALVKENERLKSQTDQTIKVNMNVVDHARIEDMREKFAKMAKVITDSPYIHLDSDATGPHPSPVKPKPELEPESDVMDTLLYRKSTGPARRRITPLKGGSPPAYDRERRILTPKGRLTPPFSLSRGQSSMVSESGRMIDTVLEEDEKDDDEDSDAMVE